MTTKHGSHLSSTLPAVLKEYLPDYEPVYIESGTRSTNVAQEQSEDAAEPQHQVQENVRHDADTSVKKDKISPPQPVRSKSPRRTDKRTSNQKFAELSAKWDSAKQEPIEDHYEILTKKVASQRDIIKKQDEIARQRRMLLLQEEKQQKETEKARRNEIEKAFKDIARQSVEEDKKAQALERRIRIREAKAREAAKAEIFPESELLPTTRDKMPIKKGGFKASLPPMTRTPSNVDMSTDSYRKASPIKEDMEWHQEQLYKVFGDQADDFLNPKIEQPVKKANNPKLQKHGGRAGAQRLWEILRKESLLRLLQEDRRVPLELKEAYSAFVRQGLQKNWRYIPRSFASSEDVPDLKRLQDRSIQVRVRKKKHKTDLMFRASVSNKDRTEILTHNNPLPDINEEGLDSSVGRYLPSWLDIGSEMTEPEYMKWVRESQETKQEYDDEEQEQDNLNHEDDYDTLDQDLIMLLTRKRKPEPKPKIVFLSEKEARCKGQFTEKFKEQRENKNVPKSFAEPKVPDFKSHSVLGMDSGDLHSVKSDDRPSCQSAPLPDKQHRMYREYVSNWEPLSMNALVEYKDKIELEGDGDFSMGRPKMWATEIKAI